MPQMQDEAGNIWNVDEAGNVLGLARPAQQSAGRVVSLPMSAKDQRQEARQSARDEREAAQDAIENEIKRAELALKQQQLTKGETAGGNRGSTIDKAAARRAAIEALTKQMMAVDRQLRENFEGPNDRGLMEYLPTPTNKTFDAAAAGMSDQALGAFRVPGVGAQSDAELRAYVRANELNSSQYDEVNRQRFNNVRNRVDEARKSMGMDPIDWDNQAQQRANSEVPDPAVGVLPKDPGTDRSPPGAPPANGPPDPAMKPATAGTKSDYSPRLSAQVNSMINAGAGEATINAILKQQGYPTLKPGTYNAARQWMQKTGKAFPLSNTIVDRDVPLSMIEEAAASPFGAATANFADAITAGTTTALGGDKAKGALAAMKAMHPGASLTGMGVGGVAGAMGAEMALAARAPAALTRFAPRIADALYGGLSGFNSADDGKGAEGALMGAGAGILGGVVGERLARGVGAVTRGVRNPNVQLLRDRGIPLTVGQTVGDTGTLGRTVKGIEDALTSIPGVGNMIDARRLEGLGGFNRAAFQDAAAPGAVITETGAAGLGQVRQSVSDAYSRALDPVSINANETQFIDDLDELVRSTQRIPNVNGAQDAAMAGLESRIDGAIDPVTDMMTGRGFQEAYRGLARTGRERASSDYGYEVGQVMRQGQDALGEALERQNPGAFDAFVEANSANRRANVLAQAINPNAADELITPAQLNRADYNSTSKLTSKINAAAGNRPFYELAQAGQAVLPSRLPNSGTADRMMTAGLLGTVGIGGAGGYALGGQEGAGTGIGATAALALGGTRGGQRLLTSLLADRPDAVIRIADQFDNNPALGQILRRLASGAGVTSGLAIGSP